MTAGKWNLVEWFRQGAILAMLIPRDMGPREKKRLLAKIRTVINIVSLIAVGVSLWTIFYYLVLHIFPFVCK